MMTVNLSLISKRSMATCVMTMLMICASFSNLSALKTISQFPHHKVTSSSRLHLVDPDTANSIITSNIPFLQGLTLPVIPSIDVSKIDSLKMLQPLLSSGESHLGWFGMFDSARFSFLPGETKTFLLSLPVIARIGLGFIALDVLPAIADVILLRVIWSKFIAVKQPLKDIDITTLPKIYDVEKIAEFYAKNPRLVLARTTEIIVLAKDFLFGLLSDYQKKAIQTNQPTRAIQFTELITTLGPTFIKVGQALSIRPDLASPAYLEELVKLQDQVPPFSSIEALKIIESQLIGVTPVDLFETLTSFEKPVAAASLGQVYKARLKKTGVAVAVKVQRPDMLLKVTLDLYIVRNLFVFCQIIPRIAEECKGLVSVVDNWAGRFQDELDYLQEVDSAETFKSQMADSKTTMGDTVVVPAPYREYSSEKLLISQWIDGTKLSKIDTSSEKGKDTVRKLTRVLLNSYLVQLLETGFLHADPHPGNFLVTSEGKLCILDYGLMTTVDEDKRFALLEFVSNLLAKDYESTLDGLVILGFVPDEIVNDPAKRKIISPLLASVFEQISNGGGAFTINVGEIGKEVESLSNEYPLVIPPYFGLILRAFGALEGLGLSVDKDYSIVKECFPYLSRRLLSDDSERIRKALRTFLYGTKGRLDIDRVDELAEGYKSFAATAAAAASGKAFEELRFISSEKASSDSTLMALKIIDGQGLSPEVDPTISSATKILFSIQGNYVQELLLDEAVRIADALSRSIVSSAIAAATQQPFVLGSLLLRNALIGGGASLLPRQLQSVSLSLRKISPFFPFSIAAQELEGIFSLSADDIATLGTLKRLLQILAGVDLADRNTKMGEGLPSTGLIDADDLALVQQVLIQFSSNVKPEKWSTAALSIIGGNTGKKDTASLRAQIVGLIPLLRESAPGATSLAIRFGRRLAGKSLGRVVERLESYYPPTLSE